MNIAKENLESAVQALNLINEGLSRLVLGTSRLKRSVEGALKAEASKAEPEKPVPAIKPIQIKLPLPPAAADRAARLRLGDVGYENEANPNRQACGQLGGLAAAGVKRAPCPDRRPRGSVMVKNMPVNEKRRYWRWSKFRAAQRSAGAEPVSWAAWAGERG